MIYISSIIFSIFCLIFLLGCGGPDSTAAKIYNKAFSTKYEVDCPQAKFIKGMEELNRYNNELDLLYSISFNKVEWSCYVIKDNKIQNYYIELTSSFNINYEVDKDSVSLENFEYVIAVLDVNDRVVVNKKYLYNFGENGLFNFKNDKNISIKIKYDKLEFLDKSTLVLGFIK